jgi:hypothetical protein
MNSQTQLRGLRNREFVNSLLDETLIGWFCIQRLIKRDVCFAQTAIRALSFLSAFSHDAADSLTLVRREAKLLDRIRRRQSRLLLRACAGFLLCAARLLCACERYCGEE